MNKVMVIAIFTIVLAALGGIGAFFVPHNSAGAWLGPGYHIFLSYPWMFTVLYLGALIIFVMGLKNFRTKSKIAYGFICLGLLIMVLAQSQLGIITYLDAWESAWVDYGGIMLPYLFGGLFVFIGIRSFSRLLGVRVFWNLWRYILPLTLILVAISIFLPHSPDPSNLPEPIFDMSLSLMVWNALLSTYATIITLHVKQTITPVFTRAMALLFIALIVHTFGAWQIVAFQLIGFLHWYNQFGFVILPFIIAGIIFLRAGYEFNRASKY